MITSKELKNIFYYNTNTGHFIYKEYRNRKARKGDIAGYCKISRGKMYRHIMINKKLYSAHRLVWLYHYNYFPEEIDHIDGDGTNNKLENLREVNRSENCRNRKLNKYNKSGTPGVFFCKNKNKWVCYINNEVNKRKHLGCFLCKDEAVKVRKQAEIDFNYHKNNGRK